jgi:hypothetical protein
MQASPERESPAHTPPLSCIRSPYQMKEAIHEETVELVCWPAISNAIIIPET